MNLIHSKYTFSLLLIILCSQIFASKKDSLLNYYEDLKSRTLLVCLQSENPKMIEKLTKKGNLQDIELYRNGIKNTNDNLRKSVNLCWKLNTDIRFIPIDSLVWFETNSPKKYGYLTLSTSQVHSSGGIHVGGENVLNFSNLGLHLFLCDRKQSIGYANFPSDEIGQDVPEEVKRNNVIFSDYYLSSAKFIYALYRINYFYTDLVKGISPYFNSRNAINSGALRGTEASIFRTKTLVARQQDCEKNFDLEKAKKYYPFPIKIVSDEEFENYLLTKDPNIACFFVGLVSSNTMGGGGVSRTKLMYMQQAINADDGKIATGFAGSFALNYKALEGFIDILEKTEKQNNPK